MEVVKGNTLRFVVVVYADDNLTLANVLGATIKLIVKKRDTDTDAQALLDITGVVLDTTLATVQATITAAQLNALPSYNTLVYEIVVKLADGTFIRSGAEVLNIKPNVLKTLF